MRRQAMLLASALTVLMTAGAAGGAVGSGFSNGQLTITADGDTVLVGCGGGNVTVNGADPPGGVVACAAVTRLLVHGGNNADTIDLAGVDPAMFTNLHDGTVSVLAGGGNDTVLGSPLGDTISGDEGNDMIRGGAGPDFIFGDVFFGPQVGVDDIDGQAGSDTAVGAPGDTVVDTGAVGFDVFFGSSGPSNTVNAAGVTTTVLADGSVTRADGTAVRGPGFEFTEVDGTTGNDVLDASAALGRVVIDAGDGNDRLIGSSAGDFMYGDAGNDVLDAHGSTGGASLDGGDGDDVLTGGPGPDGFVLDGGIDTVTDPGGAHDAFLLVGPDSTLDLSKQAGEIQVVSATQTLRFTGTIEDAFGGFESDTILGSGADNFLDGGGGNDTISGAGGADTIVLGSGADHADGQDGADEYFVFFDSCCGLGLPSGAAIADTGTTGTDSLDYDCTAGAVDTGTTLAAAGATIAYTGIETPRCGTFSAGDDVTVFTPRATPAPPASPPPAPTPAPVSPAAPVAPVVVVDNRTAQSVTATIAAGRAGSVALPAVLPGTAPPVVAWGAAAFPTGATLAATVAPSGALAGFGVGSGAVDLSFSAAGVAIHSFSTPIEIMFPGPRQGVRPGYSTDGGVTWTAIPLLAGTTLPDGQADGYYVDAGGSVHVLTRHATTFGIVTGLVVHSAVSVRAPRKIVVFLAPERAANATITLMTRTGKVVSRLQRDLPAGTTRLVLRLPRTAGPGLYLVKVAARSGPGEAALVLRARIRAGASR